MKKTIFILAFLLFSLSLFAQEPTIKFYFNDGNNKQYNIVDISNISFIKSNLSYSMQIFPKGSKTPSIIDIRTINSIVIENEQMLKVILTNNTETYNISEIDSIIFVWNTCEEIQIGTQIWMCKNLDVDHYRNGDPIRHAQTNEEWIDAGNKKEGAWCYYDNDPANGAIYGKLYNWYAVNDPRGLAPEGWHVPTDAEWKELEMCLGMSSAEAENSGWRGTDQGSQLAGRADLWMNGELKNNAKFGASGFNAVPGGFRYINGNFTNIRSNAYWWTAPEGDATHAWYRYLHNLKTEIYRYYDYKELGVSVRCVRDK